MAQTPCSHGRSCKRSQKPDSAGKIIQLIKLGVRNPPAKCRDALPRQPWVCSPTAELGCGSRGGAAPACLPPGPGSAASGGIQGKNPPETPWGCSSPGAGFLGGCQVPALSSQSSMLAFGRGCLVPPCPNPPTRCQGVGPVCARGCRMSPRGQDTARCRTTVDARAMHRGAVTLAEWTVWGPFFFFKTSLFIAFSV